MSRNYKKMFETLSEYLTDKVEDVDQTIIKAVNARNNGKFFSFQEHLRGFVYAQLSALVSWGNIKEHQSELDSLFCNFEKDRLKEIAPEILIEKIRELNCYSPYTTKNQMKFLKHNIEIFERIEQKYGSLDNFITHSSPANIVKLLADSNSTYKLKYAGVALVCEYVRNVGIDIVKPDVHIKRIVSSDRLNLIQSKSDYKIIEEFRRLSAETGISQVKMDYLLWNYCAKGYGEICTAKPKCSKCVIKEYCNKGVYKMDIRNLSKSELSNLSKKLVLQLLQKQGIQATEITEGRIKTKYKISSNCNIKISCYRYNDSTNGNYAFILKKGFNLETEKYLYFVLYLNSNPHILKIPSYVFKNPAPDSPFKNRDYIGKKSLPEYGIVMNKNTLNELLQYEENPFK